ncbi:MAG: PilZ domain-containing protein [Acidobacteriota bacterium]|nr:PilZ domain-containing protein [Acidobacteriota bacterium]
MTQRGRRRQERYDCDTIVWLRPVDGNDDFQMAQVENVSSGGILCLVHKPFEKDKLLELKISLLQQEEMVTVKAVPRHIRQLAQDEYALGLEFLEVENMSIRGFMASLEAMFS